MTPSLNHTIVSCRDQTASAEYLTGVLGLPPATRWGPFTVVEMGNGVSLDFHDVPADREISAQHYAFLVSEDEFDQIFGRVSARQTYWADPGLNSEGNINHNDRGRGVYFRDPDGHLLEIITRPYGSGDSESGG